MALKLLTGFCMFESMIKKSRALTVVLFGVTLLAGCASTHTSPPVVAAADVDKERVVLQAQALETTLVRLQRVQSLAWPILKTNADLCGKTVRPSLGLSLVDVKALAAMAGGLRAEDVASTGFADRIYVAAVAAGGPADKAGIKAQEQVIEVGAVPTAGKSLATVAADLATIMKAAKTISLKIAAPHAEPRDILVAPETICNYPVRLLNSETINAFADGSKITMLKGMTKVAGDPQLRLVIAHELAHNIMRHPQKIVRNAAISGGWLLGPVAAELGWILDEGADVIGQKPPVSFESRGIQLTTWPYGKSFEREADYVGMYLLARSGADLSEVETLFSTFASEHPGNTWVGLSHPTTPERLLTVKATRVEIEDKRKEGKPLLPQGWQAQTATK